jgi:hypothetical protein
VAWPKRTSSRLPLNSKLSLISLFPLHTQPRGFLWPRSHSPSTPSPQDFLNFLSFSTSAPTEPVASNATKVRTPRFTTYTLQFSCANTSTDTRCRILAPATSDLLARSVRSGTRRNLCLPRRTLSWPWLGSILTLDVLRRLPGRYCSAAGPHAVPHLLYLSRQHS